MLLMLIVSDREEHQDLRHFYDSVAVFKYHDLLTYLKSVINSYCSNLS